MDAIDILSIICSIIFLLSIIGIFQFDDTLFLYSVLFICYCCSFSALNGFDVQNETNQTNQNETDLTNQNKANPVNQNETTPINQNETVQNSSIIRKLNISQNVTTFKNSKDLQESYEYNSDNPILYYPLKGDKILIPINQTGRILYTEINDNDKSNNVFELNHN